MAATCSLLSLCLFKRHSKSPGGGHDVAKKFWDRAIPGSHFTYRNRTKRPRLKQMARNWQNG